MEEGTQTTNVFRTAKNQRNSSGSAFSTTNHPRICHQPWKLDAKQLRNIWCIPEAELMSSVIFQSDIITKHYLTLKGLAIPSFTRSRKARSLSELSWLFSLHWKSWQYEQPETSNTEHFALHCFTSLVLFFKSLKSVFGPLEPPFFLSSSGRDQHGLKGREAKSFCKPLLSFCQFLALFFRCVHISLLFFLILLILLHSRDIQVVTTDTCHKCHI